MIERFIKALVERIKRFAEYEKGVPFGRKWTLDPNLARIRLVLLILFLLVSFACWLVTQRGN